MKIAAGYSTVHDLKTFSRLDVLSFDPADINACINSSLNIVWNELKYKTTLTKELGELPMVRCNAGKLSQVFINLLVNAAQSIEKQGEIKIKTWSDEEKVYIAISDTGAGIPEGNIKRIFEPFFTTKEVGKGTGLGLSVAYEIVAQHKGIINVESEIGKGTTFKVELPIG